MKVSFTDELPPKSAGVSKLLKNNPDRGYSGYRLARYVGGEAQ